MTAEHPAETLRRAAVALREAGSTATPPPWRVSYLDGVDPAVDGPGMPDGHMVAEMYRCGDPAHEGRQQADATLTVILRNASPSLAGWLEAEAERAERTIQAGRSIITDQYGLWCHTCDGLHGHGCACWDGALSVARAILGEAGHG